MKCKSCGKFTKASLCNTCFMTEILDAIEMGEKDPSKILKGLVARYGRLKNLRKLPAYQKIFGGHIKLRRVVTHAETGERCRLVADYDGLVAVVTRKVGEIPDEPEEIPVLTAEGSRVPEETPAIRSGRTLYEDSVEGGRTITYYEGSNPILTIETPTSLVVRRPRSMKGKRFVKDRPPTQHYRSPQAYRRPKVED